MPRFGLTVRTFVSDPKRPVIEQIDETAEGVRFAARLGAYDSIRAQHHWLSYPNLWLDPIALLARLAPEAGEMRLLTSVMKPPIHNPVELAHQIATLDQLCNGRLIFGVGLGYQPEELAAVGATRRQRVSRFEESIGLMKALWTGEEVTFEGRYWSVHNVRMGILPAQQPHPPIWNAAYAIPAARRAAILCDGLFVANQATWSGMATLAGVYRDALREAGKTGGMVGVNRMISIAPTYEAADRAARAKTAESGTYYTQWGMQEASALEMVLDADRDPRDYSIVGTPQDCLEQIVAQDQAIGIDWIGLSFATLPKAKSARLEFLQWVAEDLIAKLPATQQLGVGAA